MKPRLARAAAERAGGKEPEGIRDDAGATGLQVLRLRMAAVGKPSAAGAASQTERTGGDVDVGEAAGIHAGSGVDSATNGVGVGVGMIGSDQFTAAARSAGEGAGDHACSGIGDESLFGTTDEQVAAPAGHGGEEGISTTGRRKRRRPEPTPTQRALGLLVRREHSRKELTRKLAHRGIEPVEAAAAVDRLREAGWQDDARFAQSLVRSRAVSGHGPIRIRAELGTHGLDREAIAAALDDFEGDWTGIARDLVRRRYGHALADDRTVQRKAAELLIRRGFGMDQIRAATRFDPDDDIC